MSTIKTNAAQIGQSITTTNNFTLYQPATPDGTVRLGNGNAGSVTDLVTLTSSGNLGVGTTSPQAYSNYRLITTDGAAGSGVQFRANTAAIVEFYSSTSESLLKTITTTPLWFGTSNTERMRIDSSGNVGIGTNSPAQKLDVNGTIAVGGSKIISNITTTNYLWAGSGQLYVVDSTGNTVLSGMALNKTQILQGGTQSNGTGIAFPAVQSGSSDANTLDDYEEGTWTPTLTANGGGSAGAYATRVGTYTKVGNLVYVHFYIACAVGTLSGNLNITGLPFVGRGNTNYPGAGASYWASMNVAKSYITGYLTQGTAQIELHAVAGTSTNTPALTAGDWGSVTELLITICYVV